MGIRGTHQLGGVKEKSFSAALLAVGHLLRHVQEQATVALVDATQQPAEATQEAGFLPGVSPRDIIRGLALGKIGELGRFLSIVEQLIEGNFESASHFLKRFDGGNRVAILDAGNITAEETGTFFDIPLRELFHFAKRAQTFSDDHGGIIA